MRERGKRQRERGFSLLEVLVAVSILGLGLTAILAAQAGAFASASHARKLSMAVGLLRCKMTEVEEHLYKDGFQETDESGEGPCCEGDDGPMRCTWRVERPVFPEASFGDLNLAAGLDLSGSGSGSSGGLGALGLLAGGMGMPMAGVSGIGDVAKTLGDANNQLAQSLPPGPGAASSSGGALDPAAGAASAANPIAGMAMSIVYPALKQIFEASTRRITVTILFREGQREQTIDLVQWFCVPQKGLVTEALDGGT